jgi:hypothetical protein
MLAAVRDRVCKVACGPRVQVLVNRLFDGHSAKICLAEPSINEFPTGVCFFPTTPREIVPKRARGIFDAGEH